MAEQEQSSSGTKQRVAYDLMKTIDHYAKDVTRDAAYYLKLYRRCLKATSGMELKDVLTED